MHLAAWQVTLKQLPGPLGEQNKLLAEVLALRANHKRLKVSHEAESKPRGKRG